MGKTRLETLDTFARRSEDFYCYARNFAAEADRLEAEIKLLRKLEGTDDHPEHRCERCGGRNLNSWYADSDVWNRFAGKFSVLCPICLSELVEAAGVLNVVWRLSIDGDDPELSKLRVQLHDRLEEGAQQYQELTRAKAVVSELEEQRPRLEQFIEEDYQPGMTEYRLAEDLLSVLDTYKVRTRAPSSAENRKGE
jgi:hypothetical protein